MRLTSSPLTSNFSAPSALRVFIASVPLTFARYSLMPPRSLPYLGPTVLSCGLKMYVENSDTSSLNSTFLILSSSLTISRYSPSRTLEALMYMFAIGCLFLIFAVLRAALPKVLILRISSIFSSSSVSISSSFTSGNSQR